MKPTEQEEFHLANQRLRCLALILFLAAAPATAAPVTVQGITFSDERGDFTILEVTGAGSLTDPFVVVEDVTGSQPILVIRFPNEGFGNRIGTRNPMGIAIVKLAINHSGTTWYGYRIEPRTMLTQSSPDSDGLSLGEGWSARPSMASNDFRHVRVIDRPYDALDFDDGRVEDGQTAVFKFVLTDSNWQSEIFVLQTPEVGIIVSGRSKPLSVEVVSSDYTACPITLRVPADRFHTGNRRSSPAGGGKCA